jgi:hypothetical protein
VDGGRGLAVELLVDDGLDQSLEGRLRAGDAQGERAGALDEAAEFGVGRGKLAEGGGGVVAGRARAVGGARHLVKVLGSRFEGRGLGGEPV